MKVRRGCAVFLFALGACGSGADGGDPAASVGGTEAMAARLAELAATANPVENDQLNRARLRYYLSSEPPPDPRAIALRQGLIALEMLHAGLTQQAIEQFILLEGLLSTLEQEPAPGFANTLEQYTAVARLRFASRSRCPRLSGTVEDIVCFPRMPPASGPWGALSRTEIPPSLIAAGGLYEARLARDPEDLASRWLLNLVHMSAGTWPDDVPRQWRIPASAFGEDALAGFTDYAPVVGVDALTRAGGSVVEDFDGDGRLDILASSRGLEDPLRFYVRTPGGDFADRAAPAGLSGLTGGLNLVHADYDNDGDPDVLVLRGGWLTRGYPNSLLRNDGGTFVDVTRAAGLWSEHPTQTAAWADFDGDGWLDLFIGNESRDGTTHRSELFRARGDGTFEEVSGAVGIDLAAFVKGVAWGDVDDDGLPDLYASVLHGPNRLFRNRGRTPDGGWGFEDITDAAGVAEPEASFPTWFWDFDQDGRLDIWVAGYRAQIADLAAESVGRPHEAELPRLYRNNGDGSFTDVSARSGADRIMYAMGANHGDFDQDGWPDLLVGTGDPDFRQLMPTRAFLNRGGTAFIEVTGAGGFGRIDKGHGVSFADFDHDGDQDIHMVLGGAHEGDLARNALYVNPGTDRAWITLILEGRSANRSAIGTRLRVEVETPGGSRTIHATVGTGGSFGGNSLRQTLGLGDATRITGIEIDWPRPGQSQRIPPLEVRRAYRIVEGDPPVMLELPPARFP